MAVEYRSQAASLPASIDAVANRFSYAAGKSVIPEEVSLYLVVVVTSIDSQQRLPNDAP